MNTLVTSPILRAIELVIWLSLNYSSFAQVPYGMEQKATWILNRTGQELAGCCLQMKLSDLARFGQFVLEGGRINTGEVV